MKRENVPSEHNWSELALASLNVLRTKPIKEHRASLVGLVELSSIDLGSNQVVSSCDGVDVTSQMKIEIFHRNGLTVASSGCSSLYTKSWSLAGLSYTSKDFTTNVSKSLSKTHGSGRLPFTKRCRSDAGHHNVVTILLVLQSVQHVQGNLQRELLSLSFAPLLCNYRITQALSLRFLLRERYLG